MFSKPFKTIDDQILILQNRGLIIEDTDLAEVYKYLLTNNYYNIINGYSKPFLTNDGKYVANATFREVQHLYLFDWELKQAFFSAALTIEHHLKSILAYRFAEMFINDYEAYLDIRSYDHKKSLSIAYLITKINNIIRRNKHYPNNPIHHYSVKHGQVPIWVVIDFIDFGDLVALITSLPKSLQNTIAKDLISFIKDNDPAFSGPFPPETMISFVKNIHEIRNVCAHNSRLIYFKCRSDSVYFPPLHKRYEIKDNDKRRDVYSCFISMQYFLSKAEYARLHNTVKKRFVSLNNHLQSVNITTIEELLGFPNNWYTHPKLPQGE